MSNVLLILLLFTASGTALAVAASPESGSESSPVAPADTAPTVAPAPGPTPSPSGLVAAPPPAAPAPEPSSSESSTLNLGLRFDTSYLIGDAIQQGFGLPSVRLTAFGVAFPRLSYRLSLGQTREFSSALLPQITPVEAYLRVDTGSPFPEQKLFWTFGMFTPSLNPWWTPDLTDVDLPDYNIGHRALLLTRDLGAELTWQPIVDRLEICLGAFNGTGILGQNTNNGRAFTAFVRAGFPMGEWRFAVGTGAYLFQQGQRGGVNYRTTQVVDVFFTARWGKHLSLNGDLLLGSYEDSLSAVKPSGGSVWTSIGLLDWLRLFARYEIVDNAPSATPNQRQLQIGPSFTPATPLTLWVLFETTTFGATATSESEGLIRARLVL